MSMQQKPSDAVSMVPMTEPVVGKKANVALEAPFIDARGVIQPLIEQTTRSIAVITSEPGAVRANHYHKSDWHYCYVVSGSVEYYERPIGSDEKPTKEVIKAGELFFTPPNVEHAMVFLEKTTFVCISRNPRDHETYEDDIVRVKLVDAAK